jgi:hypothetical protein
MIVRRLLASQRVVVAVVLVVATLLRPPQAGAQAEVLAVAGAIKAAYGAYNDVQNLLRSGDPTQQDQIIAKLTALENDYAQFKSELHDLNDKIKDLIWINEQQHFLDVQDQVEQIRAAADTAAEEVALWKSGGKQDANLLNTALDHALQAANELRDRDALFKRAGSTQNSPPVFDYRSALPAYLYVLNVRKAVLTLAVPDFRANPIYQDEFKKHLVVLDGLLANIDAPIRCDASGSWPPNSGSYYDICSYCSDPITGAWSAINGESPQAMSPHCEYPLFGSFQDYADASGFFGFYDRYRTQDDVGYVALRNLRDLVAADTHSSSVEIRYQYKALVGYGAKCLTSPGLVMEACDGSTAQEWQQDSYGALRSLGRCLEVHRFETTNGAKLELDDCSRAPGEQWTLTAAGDLRGIGGKCLDLKDFNTAPGAAVQMWDCWGGANQKWALTTPPGPVITAIDPSSGPVSGGTYVHITGSGFDPSAPLESNKALFDNTPSGYVLCETSTECTVRSPQVAAAGPVLVRVQIGGVFSTEGVFFTYNPYPTLTGFDWLWSNQTIAVQLDGYAPAGGATIALGSSDPAAVGIPASVTVPAGSSGTSFPVALLPTPNAERVTVSGTYNGASMSTSFDVVAWPPLSLDLGAADALPAGASATARVSLNRPAPAGGASVALLSSVPSAIPVPSSLTIPAGQTTVVFTITNSYSGQPKQVVISAAWNGLTASSSLYVPQQPGCQPHPCPRGFYWDPDSCGCARGLPQ